MSQSQQTPRNVSLRHERQHNDSTFATIGNLKEFLANRIRGVPSWVLLVELFIGFGWLRAAGEKIIDTDWFTGDVLRRILFEHDDSMLAWYRPFIDTVVSPFAPFVALVVVVAQLIAAASLLGGRRINWGLGIGIFLNLNFLAAGAVTPSAFYLLSQGSVVLWLAERSRNRRSQGLLRLAAVVAACLAVVSAPFISTLEPAHVIEDPAMMLSFGGALTALICLVTMTRIVPKTEHCG